MPAQKATDEKTVPVVQKYICVLWPSFLVAGIETILFFTTFDPQFVFYEYEISRIGAYSVGFFLFWAFSILASLLTLYFVRPCKPCPTAPEDASNP